MGLRLLEGLPRREAAEETRYAGGGGQGWGGPEGAH